MLRSNSAHPFSQFRELLVAARSGKHRPPASSVVSARRREHGTGAGLPDIDVFEDLGQVSFGGVPVRIFAGDHLVETKFRLRIATVTARSGAVVDQKRLDAARELQRLGQGARAGKLSRAEVQGGTFSITSLGPRGGLMATPIINTPEVGILGVHKIAPRPVAREGQVVIRRMANISLTFDHRYIDGAVAADFAGALIQYIQDPAMMLFWLAELRE